MRSWLLGVYRPITVWDGTVNWKGSQMIGEGRNFLKIFASLFYNLSNEPNLGRIQLAGQLF